MILKDEGSAQGVISAMNCVGSGIACTRSGITGTLTVSGGGWTDDGANVYTTTDTDNVGIGTSTPATLLDVAGTITGDIVQTNVGDLPQMQFITEGSSDTRYTIGVNGDGGNDDDDNFQIVEGLALGTNVRLAITTAGDVGIGTNSPGSKFAVAGRIESTTDGFKFPDGSTQTTALLAAPGVELDGDVVKLSDETDSVGIGTDTPTEKLDVVGNITATQVMSTFSDTPQLDLIPAELNDTGFSVGTNADGEGDDDDVFEIREGATPGTTVRLKIDTAGEITLGNISGDGTGKSVCIKADGTLGTCTDAVGGSGTCTCA